MELKSRMYSLIIFFINIGVIHRKINQSAKLKTFLWMLVSILFGIGTIYEEIQVIIWAVNKQPSFLFSLLSSDILLPVQTCLTFPLLGHLVLADKKIIEVVKLSAPRRKIHLILFSILTVLSHSVFLNFYSITNRIVFTSGMLALCCITEVTTLLIIGTVATDLQYNTEELAQTNYYPGVVEEYEKLVARFKDQKRGFGPILLLIFSSRMVVLLSFTYFSLSSFSNGPLAIFILSIGLQMSYITFTMDDSYTAFTSIKKTLRYL